MKYIKELLIILIISFLGELLNYIIPLPVPASIYGLVLMLVGLQTKIIKLDKVRNTGKFLIEILPLMFIPPAVGLIDSWGILKPVCVPILTITIVSTFIVMGVTGRITQLIIRIEQKRKKVTNKNE